MAVYGVARDLHAVRAAPLAEDPTRRDAEPRGEDTAGDHATVEIADPEVCLRFTARVFEDVTIGPSPLWLKQRLMAAGQRPISNVVDITNYVMLACGQPLHAFDLDAVRGSRIMVRRAREGETMVTLDGVERRFDSDTALVCDAEGPSGIAGIMGGQVSEVSDATTRVLMEAATWVGPNIMRTSRRLGLRTEASARFEKQLHPDTAHAAQRLAARLMVELCGARLVPGKLDAYPRPGRATPPEPAPRSGWSGCWASGSPPIRWRRFWPASASSLDPRTGGSAVTVPPWRDADVQREADLIEEVARIHGLEPAPGHAAGAPLTPSAGWSRASACAAGSRTPCATAASTSASPTRSPPPARWSGCGSTPGNALRVDNPLSEDQSLMRPLLFRGLLDAARHNAARGRPGVALFESAHVYRPAGPLDRAPEGSPDGRRPASEPEHLGALLTPAAPGGWRTEPVPADFFAARAVLEALLAVAGVDWRAQPPAPAVPAPGAVGTVLAGERELGWIGELHPLVLRAWELDGPVAAFELDFGRWPRRRPQAPPTAT